MAGWQSRSEGDDSSTKHTCEKAFVTIVDYLKPFMQESGEVSLVRARSGNNFAFDFERCRVPIHSTEK